VILWVMSVASIIIAEPCFKGGAFLLVFCVMC
jgi:hypothetical protein